MIDRSRAQNLAEQVRDCQRDHHESPSGVTWSAVKDSRRALEQSLFPAGTPTGVLDAEGRMIRVGDEVASFWNDRYPAVRGLVRYDVEHASFIADLDLGGGTRGLPRVHPRMRIVSPAQSPSVRASTDALIAERVRAALVDPDAPDADLLEEVDDLIHNAKHGPRWFNHFMEINDFLLNALAASGVEFPILEGNDNPARNVLAAIELYAQHYPKHHCAACNRWAALSSDHDPTCGRYAASESPPGSEHIAAHEVPP